MGYIKAGSFKGRGIQYILVGQDFALYTAGQLSHIGSGSSVAELTGGR